MLGQKHIGVTLSFFGRQRELASGNYNKIEGLVFLCVRENLRIRERNERKEILLQVSSQDRSFLPRL